MRTLQPYQMMTSRMTWLGGLLICLLAGAAGLQYFMDRQYTERATKVKAPGMAGLLPTVFANGRVRDEPIAATEEMQRAVGELLNYDEGVFRIYEKAGYRISVYAAWWKPGKMSPRIIASHTPDACWPQNGWERERGVETSPADYAHLMELTGFPKGQNRVFSLKGKREHVIFWHKVGSELLAYDTEHLPPWWAVFDEVWRKGLNLRAEQLFVRVSSDVPLETIWQDHDLDTLRSALQELGLRRGELAP